MNREEAIETLRAFKFGAIEECVIAKQKTLVEEAFDMAIEAIKEQTHEIRTETHGVCSDVISRQAAIRWVKTECNPYGKPTLDFESGKKVIEYLGQMPSADRPTVDKEYLIGLIQEAVYDGEACAKLMDMVDRQTGKWIVKHGSHEYIRTSWYACDQCGGAGDISDKYCKHCGAEMTGNEI